MNIIASAPAEPAAQPAKLPQGKEPPKALPQGKEAPKADGEEWQKGDVVVLSAKKNIEKYNQLQACVESVFKTELKVMFGREFSFASLRVVSCHKFMMSLEVVLYHLLMVFVFEAVPKVLMVLFEVVSTCLMVLFEVLSFGDASCV